MNKKLYFGIITACLISFIVGAGFVVLVYANPDNTFHISAGVYPQGTITFWNEGSTYYAKNIYGQILYSGTNESDVINDATLAYNGVFKLLAGFYYLDTPILYDSYDLFEGDGRYATYLRVTANNTSAFQPRSIASRLYGVHIKSMAIQLNTTSTGVSLAPAINFTKVSWGVIREVNVWSRASNKLWEYGIYVYGSAYYNAIEHSDIGRCDSSAIILTGLIGDRANNNDIRYVQTNFDSGDNGIHLEYSDANTLTHIIMGGDVGIQLDYALQNVITGGRHEYVNTIGINISSNAYGTTIIQPTTYGVGMTDFVDNGVGTTIIGRQVQGADQIYFVQFPRIAHPTTATWNANQTAYTWFCTTHNVTEYWNSTNVITP